MKFIKSSLIVCFLSINTGCLWTKITYKHVIFDKKEAFSIVDTSRTIEKNSNGEPLKNQIIGLPIHLQLTRSLYILDIFTPINAEPVVFINITSIKQKKLSLSGPYIMFINSAYKFSFLVQEAKGRPIQLEIRDAKGGKVGLETFSYKVIDRGYTYSLDSI